MNVSDEAGNGGMRAHCVEIIHECTEVTKLFICGTKIIGESAVFVALV